MNREEPDLFTLTNRNKNESTHLISMESVFNGNGFSNTTVSCSHLVSSLTARTFSTALLFTKAVKSFGVVPDDISFNSCSQLPKSTEGCVKYAFFAVLASPPTLLDEHCDPHGPFPKVHPYMALTLI